MDNKGLVFNIQKFSIHDGPGVRTTVFLKGCPLRCKWCANPESQLGRVQVLYDGGKCLNCGKCANSCPKGAISYEQGRVHVDFAACGGCLNCVRSCPGGALSFEGEYKTVEEVLSVCLQDRLFYEDSGGGVTISGGEGMVQPDFVKALVTGLKERGIHCAIETTGFVSEEVFKELAPLFDLLLFDVKHHDSRRHREGTGVGNELIIKNLLYAVERGPELLPRIPVIPGFNDSLEDARGIARLLLSLGLKKAQLLPFHQLGERKYEFLDRAYALEGIKALRPEDLAEYRQVFTNMGIDCFI